ncbi:helix-turn-helix domain-containing protein [Thermopolyspora sp. NPDC052614]|uniref:helix-turn-helix domain-containing protein n=1 Tax=Thermopolyspora sp. NPDC052614 TaxID=3155682 RepID=UPI00343E0F9E
MDARVFLDLLAREASAVEFEGPVLAARAAGLDTGPLEEAKVAALKVRGLLRHRAKREAELAALFDTAGDLAALRDLDAVLEAIVRRVRRLLGCDIAYMALDDPAHGDTYIRVTDGAISPRFRGLRLGMGEGLGGLVAQTATPYTTPDYLTDERFMHTTPIDTAVRDEGLVAILGVPMKLGSRVIGVLFAANRSARPFPREEVALLVSLGAHAAVAIDNARLLQETRAALDELSEANRLIRAHSEAVERAALAHDRMTGLVLRGGGVEDLAAVVTEVLGGTLTVLDGAGRPIHEACPASKGKDAAPFPMEAVLDAARSSRALGRTVRRGDLLVASVDVGGEPMCTLVLRAAGTVPDADLPILERAAIVTALLLLFRRSVAEAEERVRGELLDDLIAGRWGEGPRDRAGRLGVDLDAAHVLVVARHEGQRERAAFWASSQAALYGGLAGGRDGEVVLLLPGDRPGALARQVAAELGASLGTPVTAGASGPVRGPEGVPGAHAEARRCADALRALGRTGDGAGPEELGFVGLLMGDRQDVGGFVRSVLGPLLDYDERRGTALVATLEAYFATGGSQARAAEALHIHVNTVTQRLDRMGRLLGEGWQEPGRALEIQLALKLHRLTQPGRNG